jgi:hypothetical protein
MKLVDWIVAGLSHRRRWAERPFIDRRLLERRWLREERGHVPIITR